MPGCHILLSFSQRKHIPKIDIEKVAFEIFSFIKHYVPEDGNSYTSTVDINIKSRYLQAFSIERPVKYENAIFSPKLKVQKVINKKESLRLEDYLKNCNKVWLLIVLFGGRALGDFIIDDKLIQHNFSFRFDKVFLFDALPRKYWDLNKSSNFI